MKDCHDNEHHEITSIFLDFQRLVIVGRRTIERNHEKQKMKRKKGRSLPRGKRAPCNNRASCDLDVPLILTSTAGQGLKRNGSRSDQLTLVQRLNNTGYSIIAFSHTVHGKVSVDDDGLEIIPSSIVDQSDDSSAEKRLKLSSDKLRQTPSKIKILRRLNVIIKEKSDLSPFLQGNSASSDKIQKVLNSYDIIALCPQNDVTFSTACASTHLMSPDIITLDYTAGAGGIQLPYKLKNSDITAATKRGITFELPYGSALLDSTKRKALVQTAKIFSNACLGIRDPNPPRIIISSGKRIFEGRDHGPMALRSACDMINFAKIVLGFPDSVVCKILSENAFEAIARGNNRKNGKVYSTKGGSLTEVSVSLTDKNTFEFEQEDSIVHENDGDHLSHGGNIEINQSTMNKSDKKLEDFGDDFLSLS
jgi:RNase P/RNase MRP subunit p30